MKIHRIPRPFKIEGVQRDLLSIIIGLAELSECNFSRYPGNSGPKEILGRRREIREIVTYVLEEALARLHNHLALRLFCFGEDKSIYLPAPLTSLIREYTQENLERERRKELRNKLEEQMNIYFLAAPAIPLTLPAREEIANKSRIHQAFKEFYVFQR